jgi:hypothetical protein
MERKVITLDLDFKKKASLHAKIMRVLKVLSDCMRQGEVYIRKSSSGYIHIKVIGGSWVLREIYDDKNRLKVTEMRMRKGLRVHTLLFDSKGDKRAGEWQKLNDFKEAEEWIRQFFRLDF